MGESRGGSDHLGNGAAAAASVIDPGPSFPHGGGNNFEFAFNCADFSDRILRIEVMAETSNAEVETAQRYPSSKGKGDSVSNHSQSPDSHILEVKSIYINSAILAAKSPFFYKLFSNGMRESEERHVTLKINASEKAALLELLSFIYTEKLSTSSPVFLLDVLMVADKFEVVSCLHHCSQLLRSLPMTTESAILYLNLPDNISMPVVVESLIDAAKKHITDRYRDIMKFQDELMNLPVAGVKTLLTSNDLQVTTEDAVFDFVLKWARTRYPSLEERREILSSRLIHHIRFTHMTCWKLREVLACNDLDHELASKLVVEALFSKPEVSTERARNKRFTERAYQYRPLKVIEFVTPHRHCIVYLDLKKEECAKLYPSGLFYSQAFRLGGQVFFLAVHCNIDQHGLSHCFGLSLGMQEKDPISFTVGYEFAVRTRPSGHFVAKHRGVYTFAGGKTVSYRGLFAIPWISFLADNCHLFIGDTLHLRAELSIAQSHPPALLR